LRMVISVIRRFGVAGGRAVGGGEGDRAGCDCSELEMAVASGDVDWLSVGLLMAAMPRTLLGTTSLGGPSAKLTGELGGGMMWKGSESLAVSSAGRLLRDLLFNVGWPVGGDDSQGS
jgi:hypothetical protein